jgi:hypothetical protein
MQTELTVPPTIAPRRFCQCVKCRSQKDLKFSTTDRQVWTQRGLRRNHRELPPENAENTKMEMAAFVVFPFFCGQFLVGKTKTCVVVVRIQNLRDNSTRFQW